MKMRNSLLLAFALLSCGWAHGQTARPADLRAELAAPSDGARVRVEMTPELSAILDRPRSLHGRTVEGYRVIIYNENHQNAGAEAQQARARFASLFPDIPVEIIKRADSPYWKVAVGNSLTQDELAMVFGRVKAAFSGAYPSAVEMLPLQGFLSPQLLLPAPAEEESAE